MIAQTCLVYLVRFKHEYIPTFLGHDYFYKPFPLIGYAAENWVSHARTAGGEGGDALQRLAEQLFLDNIAFSKWVKIFDIDIQWQWGEHACHPLPLYYAALSGLNHIV